LAPTTTSTSTSTTSTTTTSALGYGYEITNAAETPQQACNEYINPEHIIYGNNTTWLTVTRFYTDSGMTIPFDGFGSWYNEYNASTSYVHQIDNDGYISNSVDCGSF
jgi:hypothetical protein